MLVLNQVMQLLLLQSWPGCLPIEFGVGLQLHRVSCILEAPCYCNERVSADKSTCSLPSRRQRQKHMAAPLEGLAKPWLSVQSSVFCVLQLSSLPTHFHGIHSSNSINCTTTLSAFFHTWRRISESTVKWCSFRLPRVAYMCDMRS